MSSSSDTERFLKDIADAPPFWRSVDLRILAVRQQGKYFNLVTRGDLDPRPPRQVPRFPFATGGSEVHAIQIVRPIEAAGDLLRAMEAGELVLGTRRISYRCNEIQRDGETPREVRTYGGTRSYFAERWSEYRREDVAWSSLSINASGDALGQFLNWGRSVIEELDHQLRTLPRPFDGIDGLARMFLREPLSLRDNRSATYSLVAPFLARLEREGCRLAEQLRIRVTAGSIAAREACDVAFTGTGEDGPPVAGRVPIPDHAWSKQGTTWSAELRAPAPDATSVVVLLRMGKHCVDRLVLSNTAPVGQNAQLEAYRTLDPSLEILEASYSGRAKNKADGFESAVARLFTFCGFNVDWLSGDARLSDAADFHAFAEEERVALVVETTLTAIDSSGKLGKLHTRTAEVALALPGWNVQAVVATATDRAQLGEKELRGAAADGMVVLTSADYPELVELAESNRPASQILAFLRTRIPPRAEAVPAGGWRGPQASGLGLSPISARGSGAW